MWSAIAAHGAEPARRLESFAELDAALAAEKTTVWLDLHRPTPEEVERLASTFALDPLTVEDCVSDLHHPKLDDFERYLYLVVHGVRAGSGRGEMQTAELDVVLTKHALVTFRQDEMRSIREVWQKSLARPGFLSQGPAHALHSVLSAQADHYVDEVEALEQEAQQLEELVFSAERPRGFERRVFLLKRDVAHLRRILASQREIVYRIARGDVAGIPARLRMHFRDVYDHLYRATETLDTLRDLSMALLETHLSLMANRTNRIMRVLTTVATFILPLSLVTGWFGMNFRGLEGLDVRHPELLVLGISALVVAAMALFLKRRGWL